MKKFISVLSVFVMAFMVLMPVNVFSASPVVSPRVTQPHTPDLRPSQPHMRGPQTVTGQVRSLNWAGYVVTAPKSSVIDVKGSWTVPSLACSRQTAYAAFWVGIDGFSDSTVEQTGVLAECYQSSAYYFTWYEFYPAYPVYVTSTVPVKAGDVVYGEVSCLSSTGSFIVTLTDKTTGATFSKTQSDSSALLSSAEWITEAPSSGGQILPLAMFGTVRYGYYYTRIASTGYATANGVTGAIGSFSSAVQELVMITTNLIVKAQPSALTTDGTSFYVTWEHS